MNFETRYCTKLDALNTKEYRILWNNRIFELIYVDYGRYDKRKVVIKGKELL